MNKIIFTFVALLCYILGNAQNDMPLTFTAQTSGVTVSLNKVGTPYSVSLVYSTDAQLTWQPYTMGDVVTLPNVGDRIHFRAKTSNAGFSKSNDSYYHFDFVGNVSASGNIMSLLDASYKSTTLSSSKSHHFAYLFKGCNGLADASELVLPATTLANYCYKGMFQQCKNLVYGPLALPAETLKLSCYENMFDRCTKLVKTPSLPAKKLGQACYNMMFYNCKQLTEVPAILPAETLAQSCYYWMFNGCTSLTTTPELPAMKLATKCYESMFEGCTSLMTAPALPAETLTNRCYYKMFFGCAGLSTAPVLPATTLVEDCYNMMFYNCTQLNYIEVGFTNWDEAVGVTSNWVKNVAKTGAFICPCDLDTTQRKVSRIPNGWTIETDCDEKAKEYIRTINPLCFTAEEDSVFIKLSPKGFPVAIELEYYVKEKGMWLTYTIESSIELSNKGNKVYFRAKDKNKYFSQYHSYYQFRLKGKMGASGNVMSLLDKTCEQTYVPQDAFYCLFEGDSTLTSIPHLPATTLSCQCYTRMFSGCTSLTTIPDTLLPAMTLADRCYYKMFFGCVNLEKLPISSLPATTMATECYREMFDGCINLKNIPYLPAKKMVGACYYSMFNGCTSLTQISALPADTLDQSCYAYMFRGCTSLTNVPELPAMILANRCYACMFYDCIKLEIPPVLPAETLANGCYYRMFEGCTSLQEVPNLPAKILATECYKCMFSNCTSLQEVPGDLLPVNTLPDDCYFQMFAGCCNLRNAPGLPAETLAGLCYYAMFARCTSLTEVPVLSAKQLAPYCCSAMFSGCTSLEMVPELEAETLVKGCYSYMFMGCSQLRKLHVKFNSWEEEIEATKYWLEDVTTINGDYEGGDSLSKMFGRSHWAISWNPDTTKYPNVHDRACRRQDNMIHEEEEKELIIEDIENNESKVPDRTRKVLENGQIIVVRDNVKYDLKGQIIK